MPSFFLAQNQDQDPMKELDWKIFVNFWVCFPQNRKWLIDEKNDQKIENFFINRRVGIYISSLLCVILYLYLKPYFDQVNEKKCYKYPDAMVLIAFLISLLLFLSSTQACELYGKDEATNFLKIRDKFFQAPEKAAIDLDEENRIRNQN